MASGTGGHQIEENYSNDFKLKKIRDVWFLDVCGKLIRLSVLGNAADVHIEEDVIFADDNVYQLALKSDGEIIISEIKDASNTDEIDAYETVKDTPTDDAEETTKCNEGGSHDEVLFHNNSSPESDIYNAIESDKKDSDDEVTSDNESLPDSDADDTLEKGQEEHMPKKDTDDELTNDDESTPESDTDDTMEKGQEEYVPKKGVFRGFFAKMKDVVRRKSVTKQKEELLFDKKPAAKGTDKINIIHEDVGTQSSTDRGNNDIGKNTEVRPIEQFSTMEVSKEYVELGEKLRSGHFGDVYAGKYRKTVNVAVKTPKPGQKNYVLADANVMQNLQHYRVLRLIAVCTRSEPIWIITEFMSNGNLQNYLRKDGGKVLRLQDVFDMACQIADGMAYLQTMKCVHRDLRAANILVGDYGEVKISGFELARMIQGDIYKALGNDQVPMKWTAPDAVYDKKFSIKSDVWSYGVLLYELITFGRNPYPDMNGKEALARVRKGFRLQKPTYCPVPCPGPYYEIMMECWNKVPYNRPDFAYLSTCLKRIKVTIENTDRNEYEEIPGSNLVTAMFDFTACFEDEISFTANDTLKLEEKTKGQNTNWWMAKLLKTGLKGYIPSNYVTKDDNSPQSQDWWYNVDRKEADKQLLLPGKPIGTFLIRDAEDKTSYVLSVRAYDPERNDDCVKHYKIRRLDNVGFYITPRRTFDNMFGLIFHYRNAADGLCCKLEIPCPKVRPLVEFREHEVARESVKLLKKLESGCFGEVYAGKLRRDTVDVAVKTLQQGQMSTDDFLAEAKLIHHLRHGKLIQVMAVRSKSEPIWIITELMINGGLLDYLRKDEGKALKFNDLADMAGQIADGMAYLETENFVHMDLRAANILVSDQNKVKVAVFGLARLNQEDIYEARENTKFPIRWTAPEAAFDGKFSIKSDVWSYGVLLYELITFGRVPYSGIKWHEVLNQVEKGFRMEKPTDGPVPCPNPYYEIMLKCWNRVADSRPTFAYLHDFFNNYMVYFEGEYRAMDD